MKQSTLMKIDIVVAILMLITGYVILYSIHNKLIKEHKQPVDDTGYHYKVTDL